MIKTVLYLLPASLLTISSISYAGDPDDWTVMGYSGTQFTAVTTWTGANFNGVNLTLRARLSSSGGKMTEYAWGSRACNPGNSPNSTNMQYVITPNTVDYIDPITNEKFTFRILLPESLGTIDGYPNTQYAKIGQSSGNVGRATCNSTPYTPRPFSGETPVTLISNTNLPIRTTPHIIKVNTTLFGVRNPDVPSKWLSSVQLIQPKNSAELSFYVTVINTCRVDKTQLDFNFGALPQSTADGVNQTKNVTVSCTYPGNIKVTYQPSKPIDSANPTRTSLDLGSVSSGWYGELAVDGRKQLTTTLQNITSKTLDIGVTLGKSRANASFGNISGGGVLIFEYI
ncbi:TPA: PapG chaperone-binding domain-containing protein [Providencia rettgeri]